MEDTTQTTEVTPKVTPETPTVDTAVEKPTE
jgi:hypothetical protein